MKAAAENAFVRVRGSAFELDGRPYTFAGVNFWHAAYLGSELSCGARDRLARELDTLAAAGITNLRILGASEPTPYAPLTPVFQPEPGVYNEALLRGLDYALDQMARRGMKAVIFLNNQWEWSGGMSTYVTWATGETRPAPDQWPHTLRFDMRFYDLPRAQEIYQAYIRMLVGRKNTCNGRRYAEDPTIMTWQLANEPRSFADVPDGNRIESLVNWVEQTAAVLREHAPNQLISTGSEGHVAVGHSLEAYRRVHASKSIDYLTIHIWPFNWGWYDPTKPSETLWRSISEARAYMQQHVAVAEALDKPLVLEEFGLGRDHAALMPGTSTVFRDTYYQALCALIQESAASGGPLAGMNLWVWSGEGTPVDPAGANWRIGTPLTGDNGVEKQGLNSIYSSDTTTLGIIRRFAESLATPESPAAAPTNSSTAAMTTP